VAEKARAAVLKEFGRPLEIEEFPLPAPKEGELLVRMLAAGVCGSDVHMWLGEDRRIPRPIILGHEGVGEVVEAAGEVKSVFGEPLAPGTKILWNRGVVCGRCYFCRIKKDASLCPHRWVYGIHRSCDEPPHLVGCYAEYILLDARTDVFVLGEGDPAVFVSASCSGATAAHAVELCPPQVGDTVVVQGPGPLGLYLVAFAASCGAADIVVIGGTAERLNICRALGATETINRRETTVEERRGMILERTHGRGADIVYEAVGTASAVEEGINLVRTGGTYAAAGFGQPGGKIELDCFEHVVRKNLRLQGVWVSHTLHTYQAMALVRKMPREFARLVTHRFALDGANDAMRSMKNKEAVKAVIEF